MENRLEYQDGFFVFRQGVKCCLPQYFNSLPLLYRGFFGLK